MAALIQTPLAGSLLGIVVQHADGSGSSLAQCRDRDIGGRDRARFSEAG